MVKLDHWTWDMQAPGVTEAHKNELRAWLSPFSERAAQWFNGASSKKPDRADAKRVSSAILSSEELNDETKLRMHRTLVALARAYNISVAPQMGRRLQPALLLPFIPKVVPPEPNINDLTLRHERKTWLEARSALDTLTNDEFQRMESQTQLGVILLSASIYGALLSEVSLSALMRQLRNGTAVTIQSDTVVCELELHLKHGGRRVQRWHPDTHTVTLIANSRFKNFVGLGTPQYGKLKPNPWPALESAHRVLGLSIPAALSAFVRDISKAWMTIMPSSLVRYMTGEIASQSFSFCKFSAPTSQSALHTQHDWKKITTLDWQSPVDPEWVNLSIHQLKSRLTQTI